MDEIVAGFEVKSVFVTDELDGLYILEAFDCAGMAVGVRPFGLESRGKEIALSCLLVGIEFFLKRAHLEHIHDLYVDLLEIHVLNCCIFLVRKQNFSTIDLRFSNLNLRLNVFSNVVEGRPILDIILQHILQHMQKIRGVILLDLI